MAVPARFSIDPEENGIPPHFAPERRAEYLRGTDALIPLMREQARRRAAGLTESTLQPDEPTYLDPATDT